MAARVIYEGKFAGTAKTGFYSVENRYKSVASALGLSKVKAASEGVTPSRGANGQLPKIRVNLENGKSAVLYFAPEKAASVLKGVKGKNVNGSKVRTATFIR